MKNRAHYIVLGTVLIVLVLFIGVFANKKVTDKFAKSMSVNSVLGTSAEANSIPTESPYSVKVTETNVDDIDEITQTKHVSIIAVVTNNSEDIFPFSPGINTNLVDTDNNYYQYTAKFVPQGTTTGGPINPNDSLSVVLDYIIPAEATAYKLIISVNALILPVEVYL